MTSCFESHELQISGISSVVSSFKGQSLLKVLRCICYKYSSPSFVSAVFAERLGEICNLSKWLFVPFFISVNFLFLSRAFQLCF